MLKFGLRVGGYDGTKMLLCPRIKRGEAERLCIEVAQSKSVRTRAHYDVYCRCKGLEFTVDGRPVAI